MSHLKLYLFGPPRLEENSVTLDVRPRKAFALLIYLAVTNQPHSRDALATLFWPESDQVAARASLRRTLYLLQQALPTELLVTSGDTIRITPTHDLWIDTAAFQDRIDEALPEQTSEATLSDAAREALRAAAALYVDDFLAGFTLDDAPGFDEWQFFQQESMRQSLARILLQLKLYCTAMGDYACAIDYARRWLALDSLHEPAHRELMLLYAWAGQQAAALRQYQECQRILQEELGVEPDVDTTELYHSIRMKQTPPPPSTTWAAPVPPVVPAASPIVAAQPILPMQTTKFIGRARELAHIQELITQEANCRLLTLVGPSGIGKTRLAMEVAQRILDMDIGLTPFADGIVFVPLTTVSEPNGIVAAIAAAAGLQFGSGLSSQQQLLNYFQDKHLLLVLDHVEHLLAGVSLLAKILRAAPHTKILATSLEGIHLRDAWFLPISALTFPPKHADVYATLRDYDAICLFEQRARRVRADFILEDEAADVIRICQLVEGMPLALELAATWLKVLNPEKIADEIERNIDILTTSYEDVPARHRSMRVVLNQSWNLLAQPERVIFRRLSIFRGNFTAEAAYAVVGAELMMLASLVDKSLLQLHNNGRYHCHELLRLFAAEQLLPWTDEFNEVNDRHFAYYMDSLKRHGQGIKGVGQKRALEEISADIGNVMLAWRTAVSQRAIHALAGATQCIWLFSHYRGMLDECEAAFAYALAALADDSESNAPSDPALAELIGLLYAGQGWMQGRRGDLERGRALMEKGIAHLRQVPSRNPRNEAFAVSYLALIAQYQERQLEAREIVKASLDSYTALGDLWGMAVGLEVAGTAALGYGQLEEAKQLLGQCLTIAQAAGEQRSQLLAMTYLGLIAVTTGDYAEAKTLLDEALTMSTELGDRIATAVILTQLGKYALETGDAIAALRHLEGSLANLRAAGVEYPAEVLDCLCATRRAQGNYATAEQIGRQALQMAQARGIQRRIFASLSMLGDVAYARQDFAQAVDLQTQALQLCRSTGFEPDRASILRYLGHATLADPAAQHAGDYDAPARQHYQEALQLALKHRLVPIALDCLVGVGELLTRIHKDEQAVTLWQLVATHPAGTHEARLRAQQRLPAPVDGHARASGQVGETKLSWQAVTQHALDLLARPDWGQPRQLARNMPTHLTTFVGRQHETVDICQNLENPNCRVLALVGLGGIGKTRLAIQVAHHLASSERGQRLFCDGIVFVPLVSVTDEEGLISAISEAVGIAAYGTQSLRQQLLSVLANQSLLLILDNFEQLTSGGAFFEAMLNSAPAIKFLVTSRVALEVPVAWFYPVGGMSFPTSLSTIPLESFEAVELFVQCARRVRANFSLATVQASVVRICQLVEGMPLALELAASWLKVLSVENIAEEISHGMDILATSAVGGRAGGVPVRHQSMRVVLEQTWTLLRDAEKQAFMRLAVFRGGFQREAASQVAEATLPLLVLLVEKSLLRVAESGRYSIHELLRQFALQKLRETLHVEVDARKRYSDYYLKFLTARLQPIVGGQTPLMLRELEDEIDNITSGWQWTLQQNDLDAIEQSLATYARFLSLRGHGQMGRDVFAQALHDLTTSTTARSHPRYAVVCQLLMQEVGSFQDFLGEYESSTRILDSALDAARRMGNKVAIGKALTTLGTVLAWQGKHKVAHANLDEAATLFAKMGDKNGLSDVLNAQARIAVYEGDYATGCRLAAQSLAYSKEIQRPDWIASALMEQGVCNFFLGEFPDSQRDLEAALALFQELGYLVGIAFALGELAWLAWATGGVQSAEAGTRARQSLEIARRVGHRLQISYRLAQLAQFANDRHDYAEATRYAEEGLALARALNTPHFISQNLYILAGAAYQQQNFTQARQYLAQACRSATEAKLMGRVLLTVYHGALLLVAEAEVGRNRDELTSDGSMPQARAIEWLDLCVRHPTSWQVLKERAARRLAYVRAQVPDDARVTVKMTADAGACDDVLADVLAHATQTIMGWANDAPWEHDFVPPQNGEGSVSSFP